MRGIWVLVALAGLTWLVRSPWPLAAYVVAMLALGAWRNRHGRHLRLYTQIRPLMLLQSALLLAGVAAAVLALLSLDNPVLSFSWLGALLAHDAPAAVPVGGVEGGGPLSASAPSPAGNLLLEPLAYGWLAVPFVALLFFLLPQLALAEEELFRRGTRTWRQGIVRSLAFGLAHLTMGIPVGAALALSLGGLWFTYQYFRGGVVRSATYHLAYNVLALSAIVLLVLFPIV